MRIINQKPHFIFYNGKVHTVDEHDNIVQALAVRDNLVMAIGNDEEILALASPDTQIINLKGKSIIPGIIDSHNHAWEAGRFLEGIVTFGINSISELCEKIADCLKDLPKGTWLQGGGWIETQFAENRMPTRWDLDAVSPHNPVVLERIFSTCVCNSMALELAGINEETKDPVGGEIGREKSTGRLNGLLFRTAKQLVRDVMPGPFGSSLRGSGEGIEHSICLAQREYLKFGITGIVEPGVSPAICRAYQNLKEQNKLLVRFNLMPNWYGFHIKQELEYMERLIDEMGIYSGFGDQWLRLGGLKMAIDGGLTSRTAWKSWPYEGETQPREVELRLDITKLEKWVKEAHDAGWSVGIHVVGDISQDVAVNAIYKAWQANPVERRHQIIHGYYASSESLRKMHEAKIIAAVQPAFIYGEADGYQGLLSKEKQASFLPVKTYLNNDIMTAMSTDMPSAHHNPFWNMYAAVTRKGVQGHQLGSEECISVFEALRMMTYNGAYLTGEEAQKGSLKPGMLADIAVLDADLENLEVEKIKDITVLLTMIDGKIVFEK